MNATAAHQLINIRQSLAQEDWYMSRQTRDWLQQTPPDEAAEILVHIAEDAQLEPHSVLGKGVIGLRMFFSPSEDPHSGHVMRRVGTRAALMLADLGDARCLPPLVRVFEVNLLWQGKYQELVESTLAKFLSEKTNLAELRPFENDIRKLAERIWNTGKGAQELSDVHTELLLNVLDCLHRLGGKHNLNGLRSIAAVPTATPNRFQIKSTAQRLLAA